MNKTNLMPLNVQLAHAKSARLRAWGVAVGAVVLACAGTYAACAMALTDARAPAHAELAHERHEVARYNTQANALKAELGHTQKEIYATKTLTEQPDLSLLLGLISHLADRQIVLSRCELNETRPTTKGIEADSAEISGLDLRLDGIGKSQSAVAAFVLQLETSGVFDHVTLVQSRNVQLFGNSAASFRIDCQMQPVREGPR